MCICKNFCFPCKNNELADNIYFESFSDKLVITN